jgi:hypothetical protein
MTTSDEIGEVLHHVQAVLADHERRLFPVNRRGLPDPTSRIEQKHIGMVGDCWDITPTSRRARGWRVLCLDAGTEDSDVVYVHTPHSMVAPSFGDTVAMRPTEARELAAAILAAVDRVESRRGRTIVQLRSGDEQ